VDGLEKVYSGNARITVDAAPVNVDAELAGPLGLIASEIISNAMKHAFGDRTDGEIRVSLVSLDDDKLALRIADNGAGLKESRKAGMGTKLLEGLSRQIGGTYSFTSGGGTVFELVFRALTKKT
jgi:two-component sensor histidine kinase